MAKSCMILREQRRAKMEKRFAQKRKHLAAVVRDKQVDDSERFLATLALADLPRNSAKVRQRNRCKLTGRSRGYYRRFGMSRIMLRQLASFGLIPGVIKASW